MKKIKGTRGDDYLSPDYEKRSWVYGLSGDDYFDFEDYRRDDRFFGGGGDDTLAGVEAVLPAKPSTFKGGLFFDGGPGFDSVEMEVRVDRSDAKVDLGLLYGTLRRVELVEVELELDAQNGRPLDDLLVKGSRRGDVIEVFLDDDTSATDMRMRLGRGDDVVEIRDGGFVGSKIMLGGGDDIYYGETNRFVALETDSATVKGGGGDDRFHLGWGEEVAIGGRGDDTFFTSSANTTDTLRGGAGADRFVFDFGALAYGDTAHRAHIKDFKTGKDKIVVDGWEDGVTPLVIDLDWREGGSGYQYDRASGELTYFDHVIATFGEGTRVKFGDLVAVADYDQFLG